MRRLPLTQGMHMNDSKNKHRARCIAQKAVAVLVCLAMASLQMPLVGSAFAESAKTPRRPSSSRRKRRHRRRTLMPRRSLQTLKRTRRRPLQTSKRKNLRLPPRQRMKLLRRLPQRLPRCAHPRHLRQIPSRVRLRPLRSMRRRSTSCPAASLACSPTSVWSGSRASTAIRI